MFKVALKSLLGHKLRLAITVIAVALGVGFMAGTFVLTDTIAKTFDDIATEAGAGVDAVVRGETVFEAESFDGGDQRPDIDPTVADEIRDIDGVRVAEPVVFGFTSVLDDAGDPIAQGGAPQFVSNWTGVPEIDVFSVVEGRAPEAAGDALIDRATADLGKFAVGDPLRVASPTGVLELRVTGIVTFGESNNLAGASFVLMDTQTALDNFTADGKVQSVYVLADDGVSQAELVASIEADLPDGLEVISGDEATEEQRDSFGQIIDQFRIVLTGFALVSLAAGAFLIYNTFGIVVAQRVRELALLRSLGANRSQVLGSVVIEAVVVGLIGSLLGLMGGIVLAVLLKALLSAIGLDVPGLAPVVAPRTVLISIFVGLFVTVASALLPGWRASRVAPLEALREAQVDGGGRRPIVRLVIGLLLLVPAVLNLIPRDDAEIGGALLGTVLLFTAVVVLGPFLVPVVVGVVGWPLRFFGPAGRMGRENARRNPKRTSGTASALMLAVTIVSLFSVFIFSFQSTINAAIDRYFEGDYEVASSGFSVPTLGLDLVDSLAQRDEVAAVTGVQRGQIQIEDDVRPVYGVRTSDVEQIFDLQGVEGDLAGMDGEGIAVDRRTATSDGWSIGDELAVTWPDGTDGTVTVDAIFTDGGIVAQNSDGHFLVSDEVFAEHFPLNGQYLLRADVKGAEGVDAGALRAIVEEEADRYPGTVVRDPGEIKAENNRQINQTLALFVVLLFLAVVIGGLGITNTLALSVFERTHEIGLLRAVGETRTQLSVSVLGESLLVTLFGTLAGLVVGIVGGAAVVRTQGEVFTDLVIAVPLWFVFAVLVISTILGVGASLFPGWRAARLNVLDAISHE